jgi:16S rRNA processing protein RimM
MHKDKCFNLGKIVKPHGYKGGVSVFLDVDDPYIYKDLEAVFVEINQKLIPLLIKSLRFGNKGQAIVTFDGVNNEEDVKHLVGRPLFLPLDFLPKLNEKQFYFHEIIGFEISDENKGNLGVVKDVFDNSANPLIEGNLNNTEFLFPINDEVIKKVDRTNKTLFICLPEGLYELYFN